MKSKVESSQVRQRRLAAELDLELSEPPHVHLPRPIGHPLGLPVRPSFAPPFLRLHPFTLLAQQEDDSFRFRL